MKLEIKNKKINISGKKIAIVVSRFNEEICSNLLQAAKEAIIEAQVSEKNITIERVPGAFELPLMASVLAKKKKYAGIVCLGAVIRGETPHFDYVCQSAASGILRVSLDTQIPVGFGVVTANTLQQAIDRSSPNHYNRGREAALAVIEMVESISNLSDPSRAQRARDLGRRYSPQR